MARPMSEMGRPGRTAAMPSVPALPGHLDQRPGVAVDLADEEGGVAVAVHAVEIGGDVDVDDVAVLQRAVVGDAVADHLVDRGADRLGVAVVVEGRGVGAPVDVRLMGDAVELVGRDARGHGRAGERQHLGRHPAGDAHAGDHVRRLDHGLVPADRLRRCGSSSAGTMWSGTSRMGLTRPGQDPALGRRGGSACTCGRCRTSTGRWT